MLPINSRRLAFPKIAHPEAPPVRPERHVVNSIATMRRHLIVALAATLTRCPCCNAPRKTTGAHLFLLRSKIKVLPELKVTFGEKLIRVYGSAAVNTSYYTISYTKDGEA